MILLSGASKHADALFQDVLRRKDDADTMRNALSVLHRFRSLFNLPQIIEKNINQVTIFYRCCAMLASSVIAVATIVSLAIVVLVIIYLIMGVAVVISTTA